MKLSRIYTYTYKDITEYVNKRRLLRLSVSYVFFLRSQISKDKSS